jgi:metal-responsive CopG/Arc/MetJ family transcriptional regulator
MPRPLISPDEPLVQKSVTIKAAQWSSLGQMAAREGRSRSELVRRALAAYIARDTLNVAESREPVPA